MKLKAIKAPKEGIAPTFMPADGGAEPHRTSGGIAAAEGQRSSKEDTGSEAAHQAA
jgi:hypothetical protein